MDRLRGQTGTGTHQHKDMKEDIEKLSVAGPAPAVTFGHLAEGIILVVWLMRLPSPARRLGQVYGAAAIQPACVH